MRKKLKILLSIFSIIIIIYLVMIGPPGSYLLKKVIQGQLSRLTQSPVTIDQLHTNLFNYVQLNNAVAAETSTEKQPVLTFDNLKIQYNLWGLFNKKILLKKVQLDNLQIAIERDSEGHYNFSENLFTSQKDSLVKTSEPTKGYEIKFGTLKISNMSFRYFDQQDSVSAKLDEINLVVHSEQLGESYIGKLNIESGSFKWRNITQRLHQLNANFDFNHYQVDLTELVLRTDALKLESSGSYDLNARTIQAGEIRSQIEIDFLNQLSLDKNKILYEGILSIRCDVKGRIDRPEGRMSLSLDHGVVHEIPIDKFNADLLLQNQAIKITDLSMETLIGNVQAAGNLSYRNDSLEYQCDLKLTNFQLTELLRKLYHEGSNQLEGILNGNLSLSGDGDEWSHLSLDGMIDLSRLSLHSQSYDDIHADFSFMKGKLDLNFTQNGSHIKLTGTVNADSTIAGQFDGILLDIEPVASLADLPGLKGKLELTGDLNGNLESPAINMNFHLWDGSYQGLPLTNIEGGIDFKNNQLVFSDLTANGMTSNLQPIAPSLSIDSLAGTLSYHIAVNGNLDQLQAKAEVNWNAAKISSFNFDNFALDLKASGKDIFINGLNIQKQNASLSASGQINFDDGLLFDLNTKIIGTDSIAKMIPDQGSVRLKGKLKHTILNAEVSGAQIMIAPLAKFFPVEAHIDGQISFEGNIYGHVNRPDFNLTWNLIHPTYKNKSLNSLSGDLKYENHALMISKITASKNEGTINLKGELPIDLYQTDFSLSKNSLIQIQAESFDLSFLEAFLPDSISVGGRLSCQLQYRGDWQKPDLEGELNINQAFLKTPYFSMVDSIYLSSNFVGQEFRLERLGGKIKQFQFDFEGEGRYENWKIFDLSFLGNVSQIGQVQIQANRQADQALVGQLKLADLNLNNLSQVVPISLPIGGLVDVAVDVTGTESAPFVSMKISGDQINIEKAPIDSLHLTAFYDKDLINIEESGFKIGNGRIKFQGTIPLNYSQSDSSRIPPTDIHFESYADDLDIDWLRPFFPAISKLQGKVNYDLKIAGSLDYPDINGAFYLQNGIVKLKDVNPEITDIHGTINFARDRIKVDSLGGKLEKGSFAVQGQTRLSHQKFSDTEFKLTLDKIKLVAPKIFSIGVDKGELVLSQAANDFNLNGKIQLKEAKYIQDYRPRISQFLTQIPNRPPAEANEALNKVQLDVIIQGQENVWIENNLARLQMTSNLNLFGTLAQPNISGRIVVNKGYVLYLDRKFKITNGLIDFTDPHRINPMIDITAVSNVTNYQAAKEINYAITLKLTGLLEKLDFALSSEPALDKANIIAILTIGRTRESLFPASESVQGQSFQQIMLDRFKEITSQRLAGMTEQKLSRSLALENVSIEGNLFQLDKSWGPRVTATKKLSDRINITYSTVVGHATEQQIKLGYQLAKNLSIFGNTGQTGQSGLDLKFHFKFY